MSSARIWLRGPRGPECRPDILPCHLIGCAVGRSPLKSDAVDNVGNDCGVRLSLRRSLSGEYGLACPRIEQRHSGVHLNRFDRIFDALRVTNELLFGI
jgi:hypothetical protein